MKETSRTFTKLGLAVAATMLAASAGAASVSWDFQNTAGLPGQSFVETSTSGGVNITMRAYSATSGASTWGTAQFTNQGTSGLGITHAGEPTTAPSHAVDSITNTDIVVVDAGAGNTIDWTSLMIGYGYDTFVGGTPGVAGQYSTTQADIKIWTGNALNTATATIDSLGALGFSSKTIDNVQTNVNTSMESPGVNLGASRYLIMAGDINDAFKLKQIGGTTGSPPNQTPEPGSIALIGLGLLGFGLARKRRKAA